MNTENSNMSALSLANVEALAQEGGLPDIKYLRLNLDCFNQCGVVIG
jgi:hypothetical protein